MALVLAPCALWGCSSSSCLTDEEAGGAELTLNLDIQFKEIVALVFKAIIWLRLLNFTHFSFLFLQMTALVFSIQLCRTKLSVVGRMGLHRSFRGLVTF